MTETLPRRLLRIATPEGVPIDLELGSPSDRLIAFLIDVTFVVILFLAVMLAGQVSGNAWLLAFSMSLAFVIRVFYFVCHEGRSRGATPGKRRLGLRVVRADGGPLTIDAILTRNFTRELELFAPLTVIFAREAMWPRYSALALLGATLWILLIVSMPLWSRSHLRLGDLVAGTRVVKTPRAMLLADLALRAAPVVRSEDPARTAAVTFHAEQLTIYGIYELQVLENVLRQARLPGGTDAMAAVAKRIQAKIGWDPAQHGDLDKEQFLRSFYAAQRRHLEQQLLFGERKERRHR